MANVNPYGNNAYGISVKPLELDVADAPTTMSYHGTSIVVNGNIIGRISSWQPNVTRQGKLVYEVSHVTWGRPVDYVPGISEGYTISVGRTEVWNEEFEVALGLTTAGNPFNDLSDQTRPFTIYEYIFKGKDLYRVWVYLGCWFKSKNLTAVTNEGDGIVAVDGAEIAFVSKNRIV